MSRDLLLEIGTEEVPAHFMPGILAQLKENAAEKLKELRLSYESIRTVGTPRRSALLVKGLADRQDDVESENRGPSLAIAFDENGEPTKAAAGFARGQKIDPKDLIVKDGYVYAIVHEAGRETEGLMATVLPELITGLNFPKNMRWADLDFKFVRPIRWIVALLDEKILDFSVAEVNSGNRSRGHRFLGHEDFVIECATNYEAALKKEFIIVDQQERRELIRQQIEELAAAKGGRAEITEELLEEVVYLVEYPTALCGSFEEKYLQLPPETVITPMREHQRYFPVLDAAGKLMPLFITVRNGSREHLEIVQHGNERVLRARLADAQFFFDEDRKKPLANYLEKLKTVVFQEGLGTIYDKSLRLEALAAFIGESIDALPEDIATARRAAKLAKADLVTGMVCEFTELQGIMGREYALLDGEGEAVATAIYEHYMPRFAGDELPGTVAGRLVSLADKIDNMVATFSRGRIPTGSQDPFALRRQALGLVNSLLDAKCNLHLSTVVEKSMDLLGIIDTSARLKLQSEVAEFIRLRLKNILSDAGIRYDVIDSVLEDVNDSYAVYLRAVAVNVEVGKAAMAKSIQAFVRVGNLAKNAVSTQVDPTLFVTAEETALYQAYTSAAAALESLIDGSDFTGALDALSDLAAPIDAFFAAVMVMDKQEEIKNNRLSLLKAITELVGQIADFSKIVQA